MGTCERIEYKAMLTADLGYEAADLALALREESERAIYHAIRDDLLCKVPGTVTRFLACNSEQLADIACVVVRHWDEPQAAGRLIRQKFNTWIWEAAEQEAALP